MIYGGRHARGTTVLSRTHQTAFKRGEGLSAVNQRFTHAAAMRASLWGLAVERHKPDSKPGLVTARCGKEKLCNTSASSMGFGKLLTLSLPLPISTASSASSINDARKISTCKYLCKGLEQMTVRFKRHRRTR